MSKRQTDNLEKGGLFSFFRNIRNMRSLSETISGVRGKMDSVPENKSAKKKRLESQISELNGHYRRLLLKSILGAGLLLGTGGFAGSLALQRKNEDKTKQSEQAMDPVNKLNVQQAGYTPIQYTQPRGNNWMENTMEMQKIWKQVTFNSLESFRDADPRIPELIRFMKENSFYTLPVGPKTTTHIMPYKDGKPPDSPEDKKNALEIVYMPERFAQSMPSSILTEPGGKTVRIATTFKVQEWLGIMLAHEMSHVIDMQLGGENPYDKAQHTEGEVDAHLMEMKLLKHWNPKNYNILIEQGEPMLRSGRMQELNNLIQALYPLGPNHASQQEHGLGSASCLIAVAFEGAMKKGATKENLGQIYLRIKQVFGG